MEVSRRSRQCLEAGRGIDDANRRQAIRHAAGFVVARSAAPSTKAAAARSLRGALGQRALPAFDSRHPTFDSRRSTFDSW
jgi:hypothetical protein